MSALEKESLTENLFLACLMHCIVYLFWSWGANPFWSNTLFSNVIFILCLIMLNYKLSKDGVWGKRTNNALFVLMGGFVLSTLAVIFLKDGRFNNDKVYEAGLITLGYGMPLFFTASLPFFSVKLAIKKSKEKRGEV